MDSTRTAPPASPLRAPAARGRMRMLAALALALPLAARAGVVVSGEHKTLDGSQPAFTYTVSVDKDRVRMETSNAPANSFIYRADKGVFWIVDKTRKTYNEMTRKDIESLAGTMDAAMKAMREQLAGLPPEQRAMVEEMMKNNMPSAGATARPTFRKTGADKVGSFACDTYEASQDGKKKADICVADLAALGFTEADFKTLTELAKPFENLAKDLQGMMPLDGTNGAPKGLPARSVAFENGKAKSETSIKQAKKQALAASLFELPAGFTKKAMGMGQPEG